MSELDQSYYIRFIGKTDQLERQIQAITAKVDGFAKQSKEAGADLDSMLSGLQSKLAAFGGAFSTVELVKSIVNVRGEMQKLEVSFETLLGSKAKADKLMAEMTKTAATTPFEFTDVANGARQLLAYGEGADSVNDTLVKLGNISAGLSQPLNDIVYLYGTTMTQGRLYTADLNQFTGRGIPMIRELAKVFGVAESEVKGLVEAGKVGFPEVQQVINNLTSEGGMFFNLMENQSKTIAGQISNIQDAWGSILNELGKSQEGIIADTLGTVSKLLDHWEEVGKVLISVAAAAGVTKTAFVILSLAQKAQAAGGALPALKNYITQLYNLKAATEGATKAQLASNVAAKANPYILLATAIIGVATACYQWAKANDAVGSAMEDFNEKTAESEGQARALFDSLRLAEQGSQEYEKALADLNELYPDIIQAHKDSETGLLDIAKAEEAVALAVQKRVAQELIANERNAAATELVKAQMDARTDLMSLDSSSTSMFKDLFEDSGATEKQAEIKARNIATAMSKALRDGVSGLKLSELDLTTDDGKEEAEKRVNTLKTTLRAQLSQMYAELGGTKDASKALDAFFGDFHFDLFGSSISNIVQLYRTSNTEFEKVIAAALDGAERVQQVQQALGDYANNGASDGGGGGGNPGGGGGGDGTQVAAYAAAIKELTDQVAAYDAAINGADQAVIAETESKMKAARNTLMDIYNQGKLTNDELEEVVSTAKKARGSLSHGGKADAYLTSVIGDLSPSKPKKEAKKETKSRASSELTEEQKTWDAKQRLYFQEEQKRLNAMQDGFDKEWQLLKFLHAKQLHEVEVQKKKMENAAKSEGRDLTEAETTQLSISTQEADEALRLGQMKILNDVAQAYQTFGEKRAEIIRRAEEDRQKLNALKGMEGTDQGLMDKKLGMVDEQEKQALDAADLDLAKTDSAFMSWLTELEQMTLEAAIRALETAKTELANLEQDPNADEEMVAKARAKVSQAEKAVTDRKNSPKKANKEYKQWAKTIGQLGDGLQELGDSLGGVAGTALKTGGEILSFASNTISLIGQLTDGTVTSMQQTADGAARAMQAVQNAVVILAIISAVVQLVQKMISVFSNNDEARQAAQDLYEHYKALADVLDNIKEKRKEALESSTADTITQDAKKYVEALADVEQGYKNVALSRVATEEDNHHSVGYNARSHIRKGIYQGSLDAITGGKWSRGNKTLTDLANLSNEELNAIMMTMPDFWAGLDAEYREALEKRLEVWEEQQEAAYTIAEKRLGFHVDDFISDFKNALLEGEGAVETFSESIEESIRSAIINGIVFDAEAQAQIKKFYDEMNAILEDESLSEEEKAARLKAKGEEIKKYTEQKAQEAQTLQDIAGLSSESDREAEEAGFAGMSQETADELNGRFTAIQGHTYQINQTVTAILAENKNIENAIIGLASQGQEMRAYMARTANATERMVDILTTINAKGLRLID